MNAEELAKNVIVKHYAGSHAYGTNIATSDVDVRGIFCADPINIRTPFFPIREVELKEEGDCKLYEMANFLQLYTECNPNIIETLWVDASDVIVGSEEYEYLKQYREELLCSRVAFKYSGYATSQLLRIKNHGKWLNNPQPEEKPMHKNYVKMIQNFTEGKILPRDFDIEKVKDLGMVHYGNDIFGIIDDSSLPKVLTKNGEFNISIKSEAIETTKKTPLFLVKYNKSEYEKNKENHKNYWEWKKNRNEVRNQLEEKHGYDTKHALHLIRLMRMAEEILTGQGVIVKRPDAKELLDIRNGAWGYDDLIKYAEDKDKHILNVLYPNTKMRKHVDLKVAAKVLINIQDMRWSKKT